MLEMRFFGGLTITQDHLPIQNVHSQKGLALLCYLAVTHRRWPRSSLAGIFWMDMPETNALMNLRKVLNRLKPVASHISITHDTLAFNQNDPYWSDVDDFVQAAGETGSITRLQYAASLYEGDFLDGFTSGDATPFDDWVMNQRAQMRETALFCLSALVRSYTSQNDYRSAIYYQRRVLGIDPWQETAHRQLMLLLGRAGMRSAALAQFATLRSILANEYGIEPGQATMNLYDQLKNDRVEESDPLL